MASEQQRAIRPALVDLVHRARGGDSLAAEQLVATCRPELLRLVRSGDTPDAEQLVDRLLAEFLRQLDGLHVEGTSEVWFHLYQCCRELMAVWPEINAPDDAVAAAGPGHRIGATTIQPDDGSDLAHAMPASFVDTMADTFAGGPPDDRSEGIPLVVRPTFVAAAPTPSLTERFVDQALDVLWRQRTGIAGGLLVGAVLAVTVVAAPRLRGTDPLEEISLDTTEATPRAAEGEPVEGQPANVLSPRRADEDGPRTVFEPPPGGPTEPAAPDRDPTTTDGGPASTGDGSTSTSVPSPGSTSSTSAPSTTIGATSTSGSGPTTLVSTPGTPTTSRGPTSLASTLVPPTSVAPPPPTTGRPSTTTTEAAIVYSCLGVSGTVAELEQAGYEVTIGTAGDDVIDRRRASGPQFIWGGAGNDEILAGDGADVICGLDGDDVIDGGLGADAISGGSDTDTLYGRGGADRLIGGAGDDNVFGGSGADSIQGGRGDDRLRGGADDDAIDGGSGADLVQGGDGDDRLTGGAGPDTFDPGSGRDQVDREPDDL